MISKFLRRPRRLNFYMRTKLLCLRRPQNIIIFAFRRTIFRAHFKTKAKKARPIKQVLRDAVYWRQIGSSQTRLLLLEHRGRRGLVDDGVTQFVVLSERFVESHNLDGGGSPFGIEDRRAGRPPENKI